MPPEVRRPLRRPALRGPAAALATAALRGAAPFAGAAHAARAALTAALAGLALLALTAAPAGAASDAPPWRQAETLRSALFAAQTELILGDTAAAQKRARAARRAYAGPLAAGVREAAPAADKARAGRAGRRRRGDGAR